MLRGVGWYFVMDFSGQNIDTMFNGQKLFLDCLTLEDRTDIFFPTPGDKIPTYAA